MKRSLSAVALAAAVFLATILMAAAPQQAAAATLTLRASPTTVSTGQTVTLSGRISPKLTKPTTLTLSWSRNGTTFATLKKLSLPKGAAGYSAKWTASSSLGPAYFRARLGTVGTGKVKVTVLGQADVQIRSFAFAPKTLTVKAWTRVVWTNGDPASHTVTAVDGLAVGAALTGLFDSGPLASGQTFSFTFSKPGTYFYECAIHRSDPAMHAEVVVQ